MLSLSTDPDGAAKRNLLRKNAGSGIIRIDCRRETVELRDSAVAVDQDAFPFADYYSLIEKEEL
jgi:hypothetical protein